MLLLIKEHIPETIQKDLTELIQAIMLLTIPETMLVTIQKDLIDNTLVTIAVPIQEPIQEPLLDITTTLIQDIINHQLII